MIWYLVALLTIVAIFAITEVRRMGRDFDDEANTGLISPPRKAPKGPAP